MLIVYDDDDRACIMCRRGPGIEGEDKNLGGDEIGISVEPGPAEGIWVYDVHPQFCEDYSEGYPTGYGSLEYDKGTFRKPTEREWNYIQNCDMKGLYEYWSDIVSQEQWSEQEATRMSGADMMPLEEEKP
jgi:hypothetical protein